MTSPPQAELVGRVGAAPMRVPPHDNEAEQSVLGSILIDREALAIVRDVLVPGDFYAERHAVLFRAALALVAASAGLTGASVARAASCAAPRAMAAASCRQGLRISPVR